MGLVQGAKGEFGFYAYYKLMRSMYDIMPDVKIIMDSSTHNEMDALCYRYDGFYRVMKLLEMTAQAIADGTIKVPAHEN